MQLRQTAASQQTERDVRWKRLISAGTAVMAGATTFLALSRLIFQWQFPEWLWLGDLTTAPLLILLGGATGWLLWRTLAQERPALQALLPFLPLLLLNGVSILNPQSGLLQSALLFGAALWLALIFAWYSLSTRRPLWHSALLLATAILPVYLLTMGRTVGRADTFEFQVVIPKLGIVHPTGYPLYLLLGKLFTFIPLGSVAWRINLASVVYALGAAILLFLLVRHLTDNTPVALLAALLMALRPTFWSQAIEAEVYTLHALIVLAALYLMTHLLTTQAKSNHLILLAALLGLGLTNHLTTTILLPAALLTILFFLYDHYQQPPPNPQSPIPNLQSLLPKLLPAFLLPLLLYAYLPLRWAAVNHEPMGMARFLDWVIGGRFKGALQLWAWLEDPSRYGIVGRLLLAEWQPALLLLIALPGLLYLLLKQSRVGLILLLSLLGFLYYGLSYYVPDLSVFLLPAHLILAIFWGVGLAWLLRLGERLIPALPPPLLQAAAITLLVWPLATRAAADWPALDRSQSDGGTEWAAGVLQMSLEEEAAILADSERFPPLYYLQQAEGVRPDLDIIVAPDEAAYRQELGGRLAAGQTVYLARFIPGLEGTYHLRSHGPLVEVAQAPLQEIPDESQDSALTFGSIQLVGHHLQPVASVDNDAAALTLYWQAQNKVEEPLFVYMRWQSEAYTSAPIPAGGQHPAGNYYPTVAWEPGEVVPDYHLLPLPILNEAGTVTIEVALAPPFTAPEMLEWQAVTSMVVEPVAEPRLPRSLAMQIGPLAVDGAQFAGQARPGSQLEILLSGCGSSFPQLALELWLAVAADEVAALTSAATNQEALSCAETTLHRRELAIDAEISPGAYVLWASYPEQPARCHWLARPTSGCRLGTVQISGAPLPEGATNYDDKIALLNVDVPDVVLQAGGQLQLTLTWQALAPINEDYTVFVQVVDEQDRIVGQVDSWPRQGTYPTSQWNPGEVIVDGYRVQLDSDLPPGSYRLLVGWYLLATQQRLPVLDESGAIIDDRLVIPGLTAQ